MPLNEIAPGLHRLPLLPLDNLNVYVIGNVLVDSGAVFTRRRLLRELARYPLQVHVLTHAHPDHQGSSHALCAERGVPLWCGALDRAAVESGSFSSVLPQPPSFVTRMAAHLAGDTHEVGRTLEDGDSVGDFEVLETPGHTPGHISLWRSKDRVVVLGDVAFNRNPVSFRPGLREPFRSVTWNPAMNRESARRVAALRPSLICFGHGEPMNGARFADWVSTLPDH
jgi:hydroxyacylglutathione hydrolase